jgi:hypothetical protein
MAPKADDNSTPITLIPLSAARDLAVETLLSPPWAEQLIIKWLYLRRVRWQYEMVVGQPGPGRTLEQEAKALWAQPTRVLVDWREGCARRVTVYRKDRAGCLKPARYITVIGIHVVREDIEHQRAQMPRTLVESVASAPTLAPVSTLTATNRRTVEPWDWFNKARRENPRHKDEKKAVWAARLTTLMEADPTVKSVWKVPTMERALREQRPKQDVTPDMPIHSPRQR